LPLPRAKEASDDNSDESTTDVHRVANLVVTLPVTIFAYALVSDAHEEEATIANAARFICPP
jgi:hypothetical protein